jgi:hypothetical protein
MSAHGRRGHTAEAQSAGAGRQRRGRIRSLRSAIAWIALGGAMVMGATAAVPAAAGACPSWAHIKGFQGHSTTDFTGTASGSDNAGGTVSVELSRSGIAAIKFVARIPKSGSGPVEFLGATTASVVGATATSIDVSDTYSDKLPNGTITARQDASGASLAKTPGDLAFMTFDPGKCTYQLHFGFAVKTTSTGQFAESALGLPDNGAGASVITPPRKIPAGFKLHGTATVPVFYECSAGKHPTGCYEYTGLGSTYAWPEEYDMLKTCNSIVATSCGSSGTQEGTATIGWTLKPAVPKTSTKHH